MKNKSTDTLNHEIKAADSIDGFLAQNRDELLSQSLLEHLASLLEQKAITRADVVRGSLLDRKYAYQIFSSEKTPSRDKLIAIAFGLGLSLDETQAMLKLSVNRELY
jgi:transcriptional regulator with XRE-family HTH domain